MRTEDGYKNKRICYESKIHFLGESYCVLKAKVRPCLTFS